LCFCTLVFLVGRTPSAQAYVIYSHALTMQPVGWVDTTGDWDFGTNGAHAHIGGGWPYPMVETDLYSCDIIIPEFTTGPVHLELQQVFETWGNCGGAGNLYEYRNGSWAGHLWGHNTYGYFYDAVPISVSMHDLCPGDTLSLRFRLQAGPLEPGDCGYAEWTFHDILVECDVAPLQHDTWAEIKSLFY